MTLFVVVIKTKRFHNVGKANTYLKIKITFNYHWLQRRISLLAISTPYIYIYIVYILYIYSCFFVKLYLDIMDDSNTS